MVFGDDRSLLVVGAERIARTNEDIRQKHCGGDVGGSDIGGKTTVTSSGGSVLLLCGETLTVLKCIVINLLCVLSNFVVY